MSVKTQKQIVKLVKSHDVFYQEESARNWYVNNSCDLDLVTQIKASVEKLLKVKSVKEVATERKAKARERILDMSKKLMSPGDITPFGKTPGRAGFSANIREGTTEVKNLNK